MNIIEFTLATKKILCKLFTSENVCSVKCKPDEKRTKIHFIITFKDKKCAGFIFFNSKLSNKDIRNILFTYKRRLFDLIQKEKLNANYANEKICPGVHQ